MAGTPLDLDTVLELCRNRHRRIILAVFAAEERSLTLRDLMQTIARYDYHGPLSELSDEERNEILLKMHHNHIPRLEARSLVEYDPDGRLVVPTEQFDRLQPHLSTVIDADPDLEPPLEL